MRIRESDIAAIYTAVSTILHIREVLSDTTLTWDRRAHSINPVLAHTTHSWLTVNGGAKYVDIKRGEVFEENNWTVTIRSSGMEFEVNGGILGKDTVTVGECPRPVVKESAALAVDLIEAATEMGIPPKSQCRVVTEFINNGHTDVAEFRNGIIAIRDSNLLNAPELLRSLFPESWEHEVVTGTAASFEADEVMRSSNRSRTTTSDLIKKLSRVAENAYG